MRLSLSLQGTRQCLPRQARSNAPAIFAFPYGCCTIDGMALDPANPPIWLRKLHVTAAQLTPDQYAPSPEEGILLCCRLSDSVREWSQACAQALKIPPLPPRLPLDNQFRLTVPRTSFDVGLRNDDATH